MKRFDVFLKALLQAVFRKYPHDESKCKENFEIIKSRTNQNKKGE